MSYEYPPPGSRAGAAKGSPGREVIAARQLVDGWVHNVVVPKMLVFDTPWESYLAFSEWLYARAGGTTGDEYPTSFTMEVFRRMLPRYDVFQLVLAYLPKQKKVEP